jgi:WD40 repeat protein
MYHDVSTKRLFLGDNGGLIHVYSIKKYPPKRLTSIKTSVTVGINSITCSDDHSKLFAGTAEGTIICLNLGHYGKEKRESSEYKYSLKGKTNCVSLTWDDANGGLLSGNESGNVAFWSPEENKCDYVFNAHMTRVTSMQWNKEDRRLITGSSDGKIKVWQLPKSWVDPVNAKKGKTLYFYI